MKFQKLNPLSLVLLPLLLTGYAPAKSSAAEARLPLWKVESKTNTIYLLGSIHVLNKTNYPLAAPIEAAFTNAQVVAFETDIDEMNNPATQMKMVAKAQLPGDETLKDQLSPETYKKFIAYADEAGLPEVMLAKFKPVMAAVTVLMMDMMKMGLDPTDGVDQHFHRRAKRDGKKIVPLESVDFQINLLTGFSKDEGELVVKSMLKEADGIRKSLGDMVKAWETGDAAALDKLLNEATKDSPTVMKRMLTDRNQNWLPKIEGLMRDGKRAIVIVGAAHLVGKDGVVDLLQKKGYKVTQM